MHSGNIYVSGKALSDFGVYATDGQIFTSPKPRYTKYNIDGRAGALLIEEDGLDNITITYPAVIYEDFMQNYPILRSFLFDQSGYRRIEDTFAPDRFRLGKPIGDITPKSSKGHQTRLFDLKFDCRPQWYLKSGEAPIRILPTETRGVVNPSYTVALPKIVVLSGTGTIAINDQLVVISENNGNLVIDSEMQDCYEGAINRNGDVSLSKDYPRLLPGENYISVDPSLTIDLYPRWWLK